MQTLEDLIKQLPPALQEEVKDFTEFLLEKKRRKIGKNFVRIGLVHQKYRNKYTSLELQKKALEWRGTNVYLVDTNVWLERLLNQKNSEEVRLLLDNIPAESLYITDFAFHSIILILCKLNETETMRRFVQDIFIDGDVNYIHLKPEDTRYLIDIMKQFKLDFDDAYQYFAAKNIV